MSVVWTTIAIIALLLPGVFFFIGLATYERLSREIIRSGVVSEIALATVVAVVLHLACLSLLSTVFGFRLSQYILPVAAYKSSSELVVVLTSRLVPSVLYFLATAIVGFGLGVVAAMGVLNGSLRFLAKHKWVYDVIDRDRKGGTVTAFVMTTIIEDGKVLMYRGRVHEIFLIQDGKISYVILKDCARFYMTFGSDAPTMGKQLELFGGEDAARRAWDYLLIDGDNIANILFDPSAKTIKSSDEGLKALKEAVRKHKEALGQQSQNVVAQRLRDLQRMRNAANNPSTGAKSGE